jgi:hypothetical protein
MRRTSVVAPLLLIAFGAMFLARNLYPDLPLLDYLAKYWPFLLIVWGGLRLAEVLFWVATDKPLPARGVSGGEWALVFFLCFFGGSLHAVRGFSPWWSRNVVIGGLDVFGESYEYPISGEKKSTKNPHVVIESFRGNAKITGVDSDTVKVTGHRTIRSLDQSGADAANRDTNFELGGDSGDVVIVRNNSDRLSGGRVRLTADMEITVPKGATVEAHGRLGDFDISDINGNVEIISDNAGVRLQNLGGEARIDTRASDIIRVIGVKGLVDVKGRGHDIDLQNIEGPVTIAGAYSGVLQFRNLSKPLRFNGEKTDFNVEKLPGQIRMALGDFTATNVVGPMHVSARSRDITISDFTNELEVVVDRGDLNLRPSLPIAHLDVQTRAGDIQLSLPPSAKFDLTASTTHGEADNQFGAPIHQQDDGRGASIRGSVAGGPVLSLRTERGRVVVRKASADDRPALPLAEDPGTIKSLPPVKTLKKIEQ